MYEEAKEMFEKGASLRFISKELNISRKTLSNMLKADGYKIKSRGITTGIGKYKHNTNAFKKIDSEQSAYWLGFLMADGYIHATNSYIIEVGLAAKDEPHLRKFLNFISPSAPIKSRLILLDGNEYETRRVSICSKEIVNDLINLGCLPGKSLTLKWPILPSSLIHHFMRGYFDGDGSIHYRRDNQLVFNVLGTLDFLQAYMDMLISKAGLNRVKLKQKQGNKALHLTYAGNGNASKIKQFLYRDATVYLDRKYKIFAVLDQNH